MQKIYDYWQKIMREKSNMRMHFRSDLKTVKISKLIEIPAELCKIISGQKPKTMNEKHKADMIRASAEPAPERLRKITEIVSDPSLYQAAELESFGIKVDSTPMRADGVVLSPPVMKDGNNAEIKVRLQLHKLKLTRR